MFKLLQMKFQACQAFCKIAKKVYVVILLTESKACMKHACETTSLFQLNLLGLFVSMIVWKVTLKSEKEHLDNYLQNCRQ